MNDKTESIQEQLIEACEAVERAWVGDGIDMATAVDMCLEVLSLVKKETD